MKTKAVRIHGKNDIRLDEFDLPAMKDNEILARVISDSICMSSYKAAKQGPEHKRVPDDVDEEPTIIGHEFSGTILEVGAAWRDEFKPGDKFSIQPALGYKGSLDAPGYSYRTIGGDATHIVIPHEVMECGCLLPYKGPGFFPASLSEPMSCIVGAFHASYHTTLGSYTHHMGMVKGGRMALLAGCGPMGLGTIDYALHYDRRPSLLVVTDIDAARLGRAEQLFPPAEAEKLGVKLLFVNTKDDADPVASLRGLADDKGYDDVLVMAPVRPVVETGDGILGWDGCMNFFAGPTDKNFSALFNFYNVHYGSTHIVGTSGGNTDDMKEALAMMAKDLIRPAVMVTHIGGLDCVVETTLHLPEIPGGKKLVYTNVSLPLTAIADFAEKGKNDPLFAKLAEITDRHAGLWSVEAEECLLANAKAI